MSLKAENLPASPIEQPKIQVFILTYERPDMILDTLHSVLAQNYSNFEVILSDNSKTDKTQKVLADFRHEKFVYRRRIPSLGALQHFNQVIGEVESDYFMMFHDDDIMLPGCLSTLIKGFNSNSRVAAVGGNARMIFNTFLSNRKFICTDRDIVIADPARFLRQHLVHCNYSPFPAFLYFKPLLKNLFLEQNLGKHADVIFLSEVCRRGKVLMLKDVVMNYRIHSRQDSSTNEQKDRKLLINWICKNNYLKKSSPEVKVYRLRGLIQELRERKDNRLSLKLRVHAALALVYFKYFRLQFLYQFIRLAQIILRKICLQKKSHN